MTVYTTAAPSDTTVVITRAEAADARFALAEEVDAMKEFGWSVISEPTCVNVGGFWSAVAHMRREE